MDPRTPSLHALIICIGTSGDVFPYLGLARALKQRGHGVTVAVNDHFGDEVRAVGADHVSLGNDEEWREIFENPFWHDAERGGMFVLQKSLIPMVKKVRDLIEAWRHQPGLVLATVEYAFGARLAHRRLGIPLVNLYIQPASMRRVLPAAILAEDRVENELARPLLVAERHLGQLYLGDPGALLVDTDREIHLGFFPDWYALPPAPWPDNVVFTGFPRYDGCRDSVVPEEAWDFLRAGDPPVFATPGSNVSWANSFFETVQAACRRLGRRVVFLTRYPDQLPPLDPTRERHFSYLPLSKVLGHAALMVHHGGIGTTGNCLAAGIPQMIRYFNWDQPHNARILETLGVGVGLDRFGFTEDTVTATMSRLLTDPLVKDAVAQAAARMASDNPFHRAAEAVEALHARTRSPGT